MSEIEQIKEKIKPVAQKYNLSSSVAKTVLNRCSDNYDFYLTSDSSVLNDPYLMKGMKEAVERIREAIQKKQKITVYGDYDVDGITSTYMVYDYLLNCGASADYFIPDRMDSGYGLSDSAIHSLKQKGTELIVTVDLGISAINEAVLCRKLGIDGMVVIGGDGSFRGARQLCLHGIPTVAVPGTIDRDVSSSDYTIGFDTAINTVVEMVDRLRDTSQSHDRCTVVEVMGRNAGDIALHAGIACGALTILVPEMEYDFERDIIQKMRKTLKTGKHHFIIIVAEGVGNSEEITKRIEEETGITARLTVLGHVQRGGIPTARERINASRMGYHAVKLLASGISNRVVGVRDGHVVDYDILEGLAMEKKFDQELYEIANAISL